MFPLHDRTRRTVCRNVFLLLALLPTAAVFAWATAINGAGHLEAVRTELESQLGLPVRLRDVSHPRPGVMLLEGLEIVDPHSGKPALTARMVEIGGYERGRVIVASQPEIDAAAARRLWPAVERLLRRSPGSNPIALRIAAGELTLRSGDTVQTLIDCSAQLDMAQSRGVANAVFRLPSAKAGEPMRMRFEHGNSSAGDRADKFEIHTAGAPLPCSLLAALVQCDNRLGKDADFAGHVTGIQSPDGWLVELAGRLENVDLQAAISDQFPHQLSGTAQIDIGRATIHDGRLEECSGQIKAGPGMIGMSLLAAACQSLNMRSGDQKPSLSDPVEYDELSATFRLDGQGLLIGGAQDFAGSDVVILNRDGVLLRTGPQVPVVSLVKTLVPDSRVQVPATRQTDWLLRLLPVPDVVPGDPNAAPQARLRGRADLR